MRGVRKEKHYPSKRRRRLLAIAAVVALVVVLAVQAFHYRPEVIGTTHDTSIRGEVLGLEVWSHTFEASIQFAEPSPWSEDLHLVGLTSFASDGGRLLAIDRRTGAIRWEVTPDLDEVRAAFADTVLQGGYWHAEQGGPADFDGDGIPEYVLPFTHRTWYPSVLLLVDERGTILRHYEHGGHVTGVVGADIDGDGADEVFATVMVNSSAHKGAGVLLFDGDGMRGAAPYETELQSHVETDDAAIRLVLPNYPDGVMEQFDHPTLTARDPRVFFDPDGSVSLVCRVSLDVNEPDPENMIIVAFDADLRVTHVSAIDRFVARIRREWPERYHQDVGPIDDGWLWAWANDYLRYERGILQNTLETR